MVWLRVGALCGNDLGCHWRGAVAAMMLIKRARQLLHTGWFYRDYWHALFAECSDAEDYCEWLLKLQRNLWRVKVAWCRATDHRTVAWLNPGGFEPDRCRYQGR